jgi:hypothetical protein
MAETKSRERAPLRCRCSGGVWLLAGLIVAFGSIAGAHADSGETEEVQGTTFLENLKIGSVVVACLPGGECADQGGALLKGFDPIGFGDPQEIGETTEGLEFDTTIQGTAFGGVEGRKVSGADADRFCWTAPLTQTGGGPSFRKPSGSLVCVEVRRDPSCGAASNPNSCGPTSCGNRSILLKAGRDGDPICRAVAQQMAQSITFGERSFEMVIGIDIDRAGENGSVTVATCAGFKPVCSNPSAPVNQARILNTIPLAAVDTPKLVKMGGLWCDTKTGKCFP